MALVRLTGLEPASHSTSDPKSDAFAISPQAHLKCIFVTEMHLTRLLHAPQALACAGG